MISRNLALRVGFAVVAIPVTVAVLYAGGWLLAAALAALGVLGAHEVYALARRQGIEPLSGLGLAAAAAIPLATYWAKGSERHWAEPALYAGALWLIALLALAARARGPARRPLAAVGVTVFGTLYASALLAFIIPLRHGALRPATPWAETWLVLFPLVVTWTCDTAAMAAGFAIGGPRLAPVLSPRKTWAGAVGGTVGAIAVALALGLLVLDRFGWALTVIQLVAIGVALALAGQVGDVAESLLKREAGVKDSSGLIPGHGGVLDRLDSLYFVLPVAAGLFKVFGIV